jgi:hypothetical protein
MHGSLPEVIMHPAPHPVSLQTQINILATSIVDVVLIQDIVQALIKVLQVEEHDCAPSLHAYLDLVNVSANLDQKINDATIKRCARQTHAHRQTNHIHKD